MGGVPLPPASMVTTTEQTPLLDHSTRDAALNNLETPLPSLAPGDTAS